MSLENACSLIYKVFFCDLKTSMSSFFIHSIPKTKIKFFPSRHEFGIFFCL